MSVRPVAWWLLNLWRTSQSDLREKSIAQSTVPMAAIGTAPSARSRPAGMRRCPGLTYRRDAPELRNGGLVFHLIPNCGTLAFGMDANRVARNFQFRPAAPGQLRRDLLVW